MNQPDNVVGKLAPGDLYIGAGGYFQPLGYLSTGGVPIDYEPDHRTHARGEVLTDLWPQRETITATLEYTNPAVMDLLLGIPENWLIFEGEHSGCWWAIPDDDRCPGALFDTHGDAVRYPQFVEWLWGDGEAKDIDMRPYRRHPGDDWFPAPPWIMRLVPIRPGPDYDMYVRRPAEGDE
ncbi:hypothetical protein AALF15_01260 [Corynebacteriaceae bacterium 7-707]